MNYFLFGGAVNVGKTETIGRLAQHLLGRGFQDILNSVPGNNNLQSDFCAILEGTNSAGQRIRVILNSAADIDQNIDDLVLFCQNNQPHDIIISAIRCDGYPVRNYFFNRLGINPQTDHVTELPMASIHGNLTNPIQTLQWYQNNIDNIAHILLAGPPFFI